MNFRVKGNPASEYGPGICQHLKDDYALGHEGVVTKSPIATTLQDMIGDDPTAMFPHHIDVRHFTMIS